jgi:hypothetical protein
MSKLQQLAELYRQMPYGGARLRLSKCGGEWWVSDGMRVQDSFKTRRAAIQALTLAGFVRIAQHYKLAR